MTVGYTRSQADCSSPNAKISRRVALCVDDFQFAGAVAEAFVFAADSVQHRQEQIVERRLIGETDVAAGLDRSATLTSEYDGQAAVIVTVAVSQPGAEHDHGMIEQ